MKKLFIIFSIFLFTTPAFAVPGYHEGLNYSGPKYDNGPDEVYMKQLQDKFAKKYYVEGKTWIDEDGVECSEGYSTAPMGAYGKEVMMPFTIFSTNRLNQWKKDNNIKPPTYEDYANRLNQWKKDNNIK